MRLVMLGAPGSGKGTQAVKIGEAYGIPAISTGDILRAHMEEGTELGERAKTYMETGDLVPDDLIIEIALERISRKDCVKGFLLDGFPRTVEQAEALDCKLARMDVRLDKAINIAVDSEALVCRTTGRRVCRDCGASFHIKTMPPAVKGVCDECGGELFHRADDYEETVRNRIEVYHGQTELLIGHYKAEGLYASVDGMKTPDEVFEEIQGILGPPGK
ncbi:MAG: adenylate kinase [Clostridiales Family XIII bacterium]|nr:adenylate kinase [Clostridiales Family XIII bacterium]